MLLDSSETFIYLCGCTDGDVGSLGSTNQGQGDIFLMMPGRQPGFADDFFLLSLGFSRRFFPFPSLRKLASDGTHQDTYQFGSSGWAEGVDGMSSSRLQVSSPFSGK